MSKTHSSETSRWRQAVRGMGFALAFVATIGGAAQSGAMPFGLGGGDNNTPEMNACAAERAPILERKRQYDALRRSQIAAAVGEGLKKGSLFFAGAMLSHYGLGGLLNPGGGAQAAGGDGLTVGVGGLLSATSLGQAAQLQIPGVTLAANGSTLGASVSGNNTRAIAAVAVVVAIAGTVEAYVRLKEEAANGDRLRMAQSIDDDAGLQVGVSRSIDAEEQALDACRQRQVTDLKQHLASASNDTDRRTLSHESSRLKGAIQQDVDLTGGVVDQQATLAKTFTQGRAMAENRSEADVLGGQAPAYADNASTTPLQLPAPAVNTDTVTPVSTETPAAAPVTSFITTRATIVRAAPSAKGKKLKTLDAGASVQPLKDPVGADWVALDAGGGATGYVRFADLTHPKGPTLAAPSNIREHNKAVLAARDDGPTRLKTLLTDVQARHAPSPVRVLLAALHGVRRAA